MAIGYVALALTLAFTLNARARWLRVTGTLLTALGLSMMVLSIVLANLDGTFAAVPASAPSIRQIAPAILNVQAAIAVVAIMFLIWSAWTQTRRPFTTTLPLRNDNEQFGKVSRGFHWVIAVLMFCLVPIGLFMAVLPVASIERPGFVAAHQSLGLTIVLLVIARIAWLAFNPPPSPIGALTLNERAASRAVHVGLYGLLLAFPVSGYLMDQGPGIDFYGWTVPRIDVPEFSGVAQTLHAWALPVAFYAMLILHLGAVLKRHFGEGHRLAVRRMLR